MAASFSLKVALLFFSLCHKFTDSLFVFMLRIDFAANSSHSLCLWQMPLPLVGVLVAPLCPRLVNRHQILFD